MQVKSNSNLHIHKTLAFCYGIGMLNNEIRIENLKILVDKFGTIAAVAKLCDTNPSYLSQILNKVPSSTGVPRGIGDKLARKLEAGANLPAGWLDAQHGTALRSLDDVGGNPLENNVDTILVPLLNIEASMGAGIIPTNEYVIDVLKINTNWADQMLKPYSGNEKLAFIHAVGDSMHPTFNDGDILMIDTGDKSVTADKIYVLQAHGRLFIKRVRQRIDGVFEISSDNPSVKTVDILNGDHEVEVKGRVLWVWNGRKL